MIVQIFWCYNDHHTKITKAGIIRFVKGFHWEKFEHGAFINYKSLFLYGSCPANYIQAVTLFLKKKEINKEPVAMLAYILCKTEGRRIKNKQSLSSGKGADLVRKACSWIYGRLSASSKEGRHVFSLCGGVWCDKRLGPTLAIFAPTSYLSYSGA